MKSSMEGLQNIKTKNYQYDPVIPLCVCIKKKKQKNPDSKKIHTPLYITALFAIAKIFKNLHVH